MRLFTHPTDTIGVDISDHVVRAVLVSGSEKKKNILAAAEQHIDEGVIQYGMVQDLERIKKTLQKLFSKSFHAKHSTVVVSLPESHGFIKSIAVQEQSEREEIEKHLPFPYEDVIIDTIQHGLIDYEGAQVKLISFAAIKKEIAEVYIEIFSSLGLHIRAFEIESQSIARLYTGYKKTDSAIVLLDIGHNHTTFVVVQQNRIDFTHTSHLISGNSLTEEIKKTLGCSFEEAEKMKKENADSPKIKKNVHTHMLNITHELQRVIDFHTEHKMTNSIRDYVVYATGGGAALHNFHRYLEDEIHYPVRHATIPTNISIDKHISLPIQSYSTAIGLALRDFQPL